MFGIYRISLGKEYRNVDFLVMENLFYGRQLKQIFDLKGSTRNRRADESNPVLLDENLLEGAFPSRPGHGMTPVDSATSLQCRLRARSTSAKSPSSSSSRPSSTTASSSRT